MKIIPNQKITSVTASSADTSYPAVNVIDEHPKKLWKAASGNSATLTFEISGGTGGLAIFNTNATSISASVTDPNYLQWETGVAWETGTTFSAVDAVLTETSSLDGVSGAAWFEWTYAMIPVTATITLTAGSNDIVQAGVAVSDELYTYACPQMGVREGLHSYSIVRELQNGAFYRKQRDSVRTFSFNIVDSRTDFYEYMYTVARELGYKPAAWMLADMDGFWWVVYARFQKMPSGTHSMPNHSAINTQLIEVL